MSEPNQEDRKKRFASFHWSLCCVLQHAVEQCEKGSYEREQVELMNQALMSKWRTLKDYEGIDK